MNRIARPVSVPIQTSLQETVAGPVTTACNAGERNLLRGSTRPLGGVTFAAAGTDNAEQDCGRDSGVRVGMHRIRVAAEKDAGAGGLRCRISSSAPGIDAILRSLPGISLRPPYSPRF